MWKYMSDDLENISLHDHFIGEILVENGDILLVFNEGFDVVKTHLLNDTGKSKLTTKSQVILKNASYSKGAVSYTIQKRDEKDVYVNRPFDFTVLLDDSNEFEVLGFEFKNGMLKLDGMLNSEFADIYFACTDVVFCWNDYSEDAWFEGWSER